MFLWKKKRWQTFPIAIIVRFQQEKFQATSFGTSINFSYIPRSPRRGRRWYRRWIFFLHLSKNPIKEPPHHPGDGGSPLGKQIWKMKSKASDPSIFKSMHIILPSKEHFLCLLFFFCMLKMCRLLKWNKTPTYILHPSLSFPAKKFPTKLVKRISGIYRLSKMWWLPIVGAIFKQLRLFIKTYCLMVQKIRRSPVEVW